VTRIIIDGKSSRKPITFRNQTIGFLMSNHCHDDSDACCPS